MIISFTELLAESNINLNFFKTREIKMEMHMTGVLIPYMPYK